MSFLTDITPLTPLASSTALSMFDEELTKPLSWTTPLYVSTLISDDFNVDSRNIASLTLVVMTLSSIYSPALSLVDVAAQPNEQSNATVIMKDAIFLSLFMVYLLADLFKLEPEFQSPFSIEDAF
jgi:hypothetical protein